MIAPTCRGPPPPITAPTTSAIAPYVVTRPRGTDSTHCSTRSTYSSRPLRRSRHRTVQRRRRHDRRRRTPRPRRAARCPAARARRRSSPGQRPRRRDGQQHQRAAAHPQPHERRRRPASSAVRTTRARAATCAATSATAATRTTTGHVVAESRPPTRPAPPARPVARRRPSGCQAAAPASASTTDERPTTAGRCRPGRSISSRHDRPGRTPRPAARSENGHRATTRGSWARRASRRITSSRVPGPRHAHDRAAERGEPLEHQADRSSRRIRQARRHQLGRSPSATAVGCASGGSVSTTSTGDAAPGQGRGDRGDRLARASARAPRRRPAGHPELETRSRASPTSPVRMRASRSWIRRRCRAPAPYADLLVTAADDAQRRPGRRGRTWCSASAAAARTTGRGCSRRRRRRRSGPWSAIASTTSSTPVSSSARVVTTCRVPGAQRHRPVDPAQPVAGLERADAGELGAAAAAPRPVRADQAQRLRRLARASRTARSSAAPAPAGRRARPGRTGSPAHGLYSATFSSPEDPAAPAPRAQLDVGHAGASRPPTCPSVGRIATYGGRPAARVRYSASSASSTASRGGGALALLEDAVVEPWRPAAARGSAGAPARAPPASRTARPARPAPGCRSAAPAPPRPRRAPAPGRAPASPASGSSAGWSRVAGVGTWASTASTTRRPVTSVIHSSGLTVIRCASTGRATALTSSGIDVVAAAQQRERPRGQHQAERAARRGTGQHVRRGRGWRPRGRRSSGRRSRRR